MTDPKTPETEAHDAVFPESTGASAPRRRRRAAPALGEAAAVAAAGLADAPVLAPDAAPAAADAAGGAGDAAETPKPAAKRTRRRPTAATAEGQDAAAAGAGPEAVTPTGDPARGAAAGDEANADAPPARPAAGGSRRRAKPRADAAVTPADGAPARDATPATRPAAPRADDLDAGSGGAFATAGGGRGGEDRGEDGDVGHDDGRDGGGPGRTERELAADGEGGGRRRRNRNRRRNRRGGGREGQDGDAAPTAGEPAVSPVRLENLPPTDVNELFAAVVAGVYDAVAEGEPGAVPSAPEPAPVALEAAVQPAGEAEPAPQDAGEVEPGAGDVSLDAAAAPQRRVLAPQPDAPKLQKVLAQSGVASRRDLEQMITQGRITVNGQPAHVGQRVKFGDRVAIDGKPVKVRITQPPARVIAYHKPVGEVVTHDDPQARPTVFRRLPRLPHGKWQSVGRLDINTEGLLLFTNSGDLANRLMHPRFGVEREYAVRILGVLSDEERERLLEGVEIDGQTASFKSIADGGGEGANRWYRVVITEGRNREVRKLFDAVDKAVSRLIRIRYGSVVLPRGLKRGVWVDLGADDVKALRDITGMPMRESGRGQRPSSAAPVAEGDRRGRRGRRRGKGERGNPELAAVEGILPGPRVADFDDGDEPRGPIPNPLQQSFDKRAIQQARRPQREYSDDGPIPNPLQQTYDKRAVQNERRPKREYGDDGPIPNPLQQTYDKRAVQGERRPKREYGDDGPIPNPLQQTYDKRFGGGSAKPGGKSGLGGPARRSKPGARGKGGKGGGGGQPDPMRTAVGYIGADAFVNKLRGAGKGGGKGGRGRGGKGR